MAIYRAITSKCISTGSHAWLCRGFVSATTPCHKEKIDKETCAKIIDAAQTVKEGTKEVVKETKRVGQALTDKLVDVTGNVVADAAKKKFAEASENAKSEKGKDVLDTAKAVAEAWKERTEKK